MGATYEFYVIWDKNLSQEEIVEHFGEYGQWLNPQKDFEVDKVRDISKGAGKVLGTFIKLGRSMYENYDGQIIKIKEHNIRELLENERLNVDYDCSAQLELLNILSLLLLQLNFKEHTVVFRVC